MRERRNAIMERVEIFAVDVDHHYGRETLQGHKHKGYWNMGKVLKGLKPGGKIGADDCIVSSDGRFRLYVEKDGNVVAYSYSATKGIWRFYRFDIPNPVPRSLLELGIIDLGGREIGSKTPHLIVRSPGGEILWAESFGVFPYPLWKSTGFVVQSDGNLVHYIKNSQSGVTRAAWAPGTEKKFSRNIVHCPNTPIFEIPPELGSLALPDSRGNTTIENKSKSKVTVQCGNNTTTVAPGDSCDVTITSTGSLAIELSCYTYEDLRDSDGTKPTVTKSPVSTVNDSDAMPHQAKIKKPPRGKRNLFTIYSVKKRGARLVGYDSIGSVKVVSNR
jgi:hypothetical protein